MVQKEELEKRIAEAIAEKTRFEAFVKVKRLLKNKFSNYIVVEVLVDVADERLFGLRESAIEA